MNTLEDKTTDRDVEIAYEVFFGRPPENAEVVAGHVKNLRTLRDLFAQFMSSHEYQTRARVLLNVPMNKPLDWPRTNVDTHVSPEVLASMLEHVEANWELLGQSEPHWSVITHQQFRAKEIGSNIRKFYDSGQGAVSNFTAAAERAGLDYKSLQSCFELGCGVGRLSVWLAKIFPKLIAADISAPHLALASEEIERSGIKNIELLLLNSIDKIKQIENFDCFISIIVLQHNPPPVISFLLRIILDKLNKGGLAYFQVPTYMRGVSFNAEEYLSNKTVNGEMEMHPIPQDVLWKIVDETKCQLIEVREDGWTGNPNWISNSVLLQKRID